MLNALALIGGDSPQPIVVDKPCLFGHEGA